MLCPSKASVFIDCDKVVLRLRLNAVHFCLQPIKFSCINDQEDTWMDVNESDTDPQPACSIPRKSLPGKTVSVCV